MTKSISGGVFAVARAIWDDGDFADEPYTERQAFLWLLSAAAWKGGTKIQWKSGRRCTSITLKRAEFCFSERFLAEKWRWSRSKVTRFLDRLRQRGIIEATNRTANGAQTEPQMRVYLIRNYNKYQTVGMPDRTANEPQTDSQPNRRRNRETGRTESPSGDSVKRTARSELETVLDKAHAKAVLEHRSHMRKPLTPHAATLLARKFERCHDPNEAADVMVSNGWQGFEPEWMQNRKNGRAPPGKKTLFDAAVEQWQRGAEQ
jgi:hypothetical protein